MWAKVFFVLAGMTAAAAQVTPSVSTDPLNGSSFATNPVTLPATFTPVTTFESAGSRTPTTISGIGPSPTSAPYTFVYSAPVSSLTGTGLSNLFSSLAANGQPTQFTAAFQPDPSNLQIVGGSGNASGGQDAASSLRPNSYQAQAMALVAGAMLVGAALA
ncbi:hypothetical protein CBOM_02810 [Ceraceosorus bombacis]|uniref:Uncharacterized protein n=1 Tax=Ceraceosorus bombacis TaxID=401625 RepID=A0A0P1BGW9_9BASI|nr:hypothetical protein CBOM_02810 [Ceraceosorus bombacis]